MLFLLPDPNQKKYRTKGAFFAWDFVPFVCLFAENYQTKLTLICFTSNHKYDIDIDGNHSNPFVGDGTVGIGEYRVDCVNRMAYKTIGELDASYNKLLNVSFMQPYPGSVLET